MHRLVRIAIGFLAFSFFGSFGAVQPCLAQADLSGYWDVRTPNPSGDGTSRDTYFEFQQSGETLSGTLIRRPNGIPIAGTFKDGAIHFETVPPPPPAPPPARRRPFARQQRPLVYDGTYADGKLMLTSQGRNGESEVHGGESDQRGRPCPPRALALARIERPSRQWAGPHAAHGLELAGTSSEAGSTMRPYAEWPTQWSPAA